MSRPTLTVGIANYGATFPDGGWRGLVDLGRAADDAGVDRLVVVDHVVMGRNTDKYVWGTFPVPPEAPWLEPLTVLAAIGAATSTVRLATGILIAPLRPAAFLAKQVATLDQLTGGRVDLGVGAGWQREEYDALGLDFSARAQMLDDTLGALRALWRDTPAEYASPTVNFADVFCEPKPVQPGGVPLWVAGTLHRRNLDRLVRFGDAWIPIMGESLEGIAAGAATIREAWSAAGRDPAALLVQAPLRIERDADGRPDLARSIDSVPDLLAAGATDVHLTLRVFARDAESAPAVLAEAVRRFRAAT